MKSLFGDNRQADILSLMRGGTVQAFLLIY